MNVRTEHYLREYWEGKINLELKIENLLAAIILLGQEKKMDVKKSDVEKIKRLLIVKPSLKALILKEG